MTGYSKKFALNKTPNFLQGEATETETKKRIRTKLEHLKPFTEIIVNYRKDKTPYKCEVKIIPLYKDRVTHFLAIEKKSCLIPLYEKLHLFFLCTFYFWLFINQRGFNK